MADKTVLDNKINSSFEISGGWGVEPEDLDDEKNMYFGDLKSDGETADLGVFELDHGIGNKKLYSNKELFGRTLNKEFIHLYNIYGAENFTEGTMTLNNDINLKKEHLTTNFFTVSKDKFNVSKFSTILLDISGLNYWLPKLIKPNFFETVGGQGKFGILYNFDGNNSKQLGYFKFENKIYNIYLYEDVYRKSLGRFDYRFENITRLKITNEKDGVSEFEAARIASSVERLFMLILSCRLNLDHIYVGNKKHPLNTSIFPLYDHRSFQLDHLDEMFMRERLVQYSDIEDNMENVIRSWFIRSNQLASLVMNLEQTIMSDSTTTMDFITLMDGIENYYKDHGMSLKNEINALIYNLPGQYVAILDGKLSHFGGLKKWIAKLVDTRVYLTHGTDRKRKMTQNSDIIVSINILKIIIQTFCIQQLGFLVPKCSFINHIDEEVNRIFL